jgi:hypothetical protein
MVREGDIPTDRILTTAGYTSLFAHEVTDRWEVWSGALQGISGRYQQYFLFLTGDCGWSDIEAARSWLSTNSLNDVPVVLRKVARHLRHESSRIRTTLRTTKLFTVSDFLYQSVGRAFGKIGEIAWEDEDSTGLQYFVEPYVHFPSDEAPTPALAKLVAFLTGDLPSDCNVAVLLAPAGQGKTTLSDGLFRRLIIDDHPIVPLLLKRDQWSRLVNRDSVTLGDLWVPAISTWYRRALIGSDQIDDALKAGVVRPILDGLDELCSTYPVDFSPSEAVTELIDVVREGRLLLTSRTQFWNENVAQAARNRVLEIALQPFSPSQKRDYIEKRFPEDAEKRLTAQRILDRIAGKASRGVHVRTQHAGEADNGEAGSSSRFDAVPFVVMLASESADTESVDLMERYGSLFSDDPVEGLLLAFCEREQLRHHLRLAPKKQLELFQLLAIEFGPGFELEDLDFALQVVGGESAREEITQISNHALLSKRERYYFHYDFVEDYLIARVVRDWMLNGSNPGGAKRGLHACATRYGSLIDRCIDQILSVDPNHWMRTARVRWLDKSIDGTTRSGLLRLIVGLIRASAPSTRSEATEMLLEVLALEHRVITGLMTTGPIAGFDFRALTFSNCTFTDAEFVNCIFDSTTSFKSCAFEGSLTVSACEQFAAVEVADDCILSLYARSTIQREQDDRRRFPITEEQISAGLQHVLEYFQIGATGFRTRQVYSIERRTRHISFSERLLRTLEGEKILERFPIKGTHEGYRVIATADVRIFLHNSTKVGRVRNAVATLVEKLS